MKIRLLLVLLIGALVTAACGGTSEPTAEPEIAEASGVETETSEMEAEGETVTEVMEGEGHTLPMVDPLDITGDIVAAGSSTVFPAVRADGRTFYGRGLRRPDYRR